MWVTSSVLLLQYPLLWLELICNSLLGVNGDLVNVRMLQFYILRSSPFYYIILLLVFCHSLPHSSLDLTYVLHATVLTWCLIGSISLLFHHGILFHLHHQVIHCLFHALQFLAHSSDIWHRQQCRGTLQSPIIFFPAGAHVIKEEMLRRGLFTKLSGKPQE